MKKATLTAVALAAILVLAVSVSCRKSQQEGSQTGAGTSAGNESQNQAATPQTPGEDEQSNPCDAPAGADAKQPDADEAGETGGAAKQPVQAPPSPTPPYITLGVQTRPGEIAFCEGQPVPLYYELADDTPDTCLVALVKQEVTSRLCSDNTTGALTKKPIRGTKMGQLLFMMPTPGQYILRLFPSEDEQGEAIGESQPFRVMSKDEWYRQPGGETPPVAK